MRQVTRFEANLLKITHAMVGPAPVAQVTKLLSQSQQKRPPCLTRDCVTLVQDALAKGCTYWLATGGWRNETYLRGEQAQAGRLWQRTSPTELGLEFSIFALDFLIWLTESDVSRYTAWQPPEDASLTLGDRLLLAMAFEAVADTEIGRHWAAGKTFAGDGLCALLHPELMGQTATAFAPDFTAWLTPAGQVILEVVQRRLAQSWQRVESAKATIISRDEMTSLGHVQRVLVEAYLAAIDQAGRRDLARWLLIAIRDTVTDAYDISHWTSAVDVDGLRVAQRTEVYRDAVAFLQAAAQLSTWNQQAMNTGYFDDGYAASQVWKSDWERYNAEASLNAAQRIVRAAEPLGT